MRCDAWAIDQLRLILLRVLERRRETNMIRSLISGVLLPFSAYKAAVAWRGAPPSDASGRPLRMRGAGFRRRRRMRNVLGASQRVLTHLAKLVLVNGLLSLPMAPGCRQR